MKFIGNIGKIDLLIIVIIIIAIKNEWEDMNIDSPEKKLFIDEMMNILINKNIEEKRKLMEKLEIHGRHKHKPNHKHEHSDNDKSNK